MTRSKSNGKKRNRSNNDSSEKKDSKKTKQNSGSNQTSAQNPTLDEISPHHSSAERNSTPLQTPKSKLVFDQATPKDPSVDVESSILNAPAWAQALFNKLEQVETLSTKTKEAIETVVKANTNLTSTVTSLKQSVTNLESERINLQNENIDLRERLIKLEFHQRRNNLVFEGIAEASSLESGRDCYEKIMQCLTHLPDINLIDMRIDRCHRLGPKTGNRSRPIIAKFNWYGDLMEILNKRSYLPSGVFVSEDFPEEWVDRRRMLRPILNQAKSKPKYKNCSFLTRDKLIIDGKQYTVAPFNNLAQLPPDLKASSSCEVRNDNVIAFLGPHSVFSNFHPAKFVSDKIKYTCAEQMIQAEKAALFKDTTSLQRIMKLTCPYRIKAAGNKIRNFDKHIWGKECKQITKRAVQAKFNQNPPLRNLLKSTGSVDIVESSKDSKWGTGLHLRNPRALDRSSWISKGLMNEILTEVRSSLS